MRKQKKGQEMKFIIAIILGIVILISVGFGFRSSVREYFGIIHESVTSIDKDYDGDGKNNFNDVCPCTVGEKILATDNKLYCYYGEGDCATLFKEEKYVVKEVEEQATGKKVCVLEAQGCMQTMNAYYVCSENPKSKLCNPTIEE